MSVWSREDDSHDRMELVVSEHKADVVAKLTLLEAKVSEATKLLRDVARYDASLTADECSTLADMLDPEHTANGSRT